MKTSRSSSSCASFVARRRKLRLKGYQGSVFIDTQGNDLRADRAVTRCGVPALAIIDHHEPQGMIEARFTDIRNDANATATIYTEYLERPLAARALRPRS